MAEQSPTDLGRITGGRPPTPAAVAEWIGSANAARWTKLAEFIASAHPGVFDPEWLFGGRKWGWTLRFKKSKSFCTFVPERGRFRVLLVFGAAERDLVEPILKDLASHVREDYNQATTYHDGKWMLTSVDSTAVLADVERLLTLKRRPKAARAARPSRP